VTYTMIPDDAVLIMMTNYYHHSDYNCNDDYDDDVNVSDKCKNDYEVMILMLYWLSIMMLTKCCWWLWWLQWWQRYMLVCKCDTNYICMISVTMVLSDGDYDYYDCNSNDDDDDDDTQNRKITIIMTLAWSCNVVFMYW